MVYKTLASHQEMYQKLSDLTRRHTACAHSFDDIHRQLYHQIVWCIPLLTLLPHNFEICTRHSAQLSSYYDRVYMSLLPPDKKEENEDMRMYNQTSQRVPSWHSRLLHTFAAISGPFSLTLSISADTSFPIFPMNWIRKSHRSLWQDAGRTWKSTAIKIIRMQNIRHKNGRRKLVQLKNEGQGKMNDRQMDKGCFICRWSDDLDFSHASASIRSALEGHAISTVTVCEPHKGILHLFKFDSFLCFVRTTAHVTRTKHEATEVCMAIFFWCHVSTSVSTSEQEDLSQC